MSKVKLQTEKRSLFGKKLNIPIDGEVSISKSGMMIVSKEASELLLENYDGTIFNPNEEVEEQEVEEQEVESEKDETEDEDESLDLESLSLKELIGVAKEADIKEPSYRKFKKDKEGMIKFLQKRLEE